MVHTSRIAQLPLNVDFVLVAQIGVGAPVWRRVGTLVRTEQGLAVRFLGEALVCGPAWEACDRTSALRSRGETCCWFGVVLAKGRIETVAEGEISSFVVNESRAVARTLETRRLRLDPEAMATAEKWNEFLRGGRMPGLRSAWPEPCRIAGRTGR